MTSLTGSLDFREGEAAESSATFICGLPSPISSKPQRQRNLSDSVLFSFGKEKVPSNLIQIDLLLQVDTTPLSSSEDNNDCPPTPTRNMNTSVQSKKRKHEELANKITNILTPPNPVWGEDMVLRHSDDGNSSSEEDDSTTTETEQIPQSAVPLRANAASRASHKVDLDPGIIRFQTVNRTARGWVYRYEAVWRIFGFKLHYRSPATQRLQIHVPNE